MTMVKAVMQREFSGDLQSASTLELVEWNMRRDAVKPGHVLIKLYMRPVNPIDLSMIRTGELVKYRDQGVTLGSEGVGYVVAVGTGPTLFTPGDRVVPILFWKYLRGGIGGVGSWQDYVEVDATDVVKVHNSVSDEAAAQYVINPWTAHGLLVDIAVPKGEYLLLSGASSVIGRQIIQIAKHWGIQPIAIVRRDEVKEELVEIGASHVINSSNEDIVATVKGITSGRGAYAALDVIGGSITKSMGSSVRSEGKVFMFGTLGGKDFSFSSSDLIRKVEVSWWALTDYLKSPAKYELTKTEVMEMLATQVLTPLTGKKFLLADFKDAIKETQKDGRGGKVLLVDNLPEMA